MAALPRGLWVLLTVWLAMSRPSAANRTESPHSAHRWGSEEVSSIQKSAEALRRSGDFAALEALYERAAADARNAKVRTNYLIALGNTRVLRFRYAEALSTYIEARELAHAAKDWLSEGAVAPGLSSLYLMVGDWSAAREAAAAGIAATQGLRETPYYSAQLKLQHARLNPGARESAREILDAIDGARAQGNLALEAEAWDLLGEEYSRQQDLDRADSALSEAFRLRVLHLAQDLRLSYWRLGALRLSQGRLAEAERFTAQAIEANARAGADFSAGELHHQNGLIASAQGHRLAALREFETASAAAERWRSAVPPAARSLLTAADTQTDRRVLRSFVEAAAEQTIAAGDPVWAERAFLALERNRAASLRQSAALSDVWRKSLPADYWEALALLRRDSSREDLHLKLVEMESAAGLGTSLEVLDGFTRHPSLQAFQRSLRPEELFLSFYTSEARSYVWAVSREEAHVYPLAGVQDMEREVASFRAAVAGRAKDADAQGGKIYGALFGALNPRESRRPVWILSLDGPLFDLPFAALRSGERFLIEEHALQVTPAATMLRAAGTVRAPLFVGVSDPIYNSADERIPVAAWPPPPVDGSVQLNRLVASGPEVQEAVSQWRQPARIFSGAEANRKALLAALTSLRPGILHLATHVVADERKPGQAEIALSLDREGRPEGLRPADIGIMRVPGAMVVMTGCASGTGEVRPGAGLLGLTRAWLAAGADGVVATGWPLEDAGGDLLPAFYRELSRGSAAAALQRAQVEMIHSETWQAAPAYWAAFSLTGGAR